MFADFLPAVLKPVAKAVAVVVVGLIGALLNWLLAETGIEVPFDVDAATLVVSSLVLAFVTWATKNVKVD